MKHTLCAVLICLCVHILAAEEIVGKIVSVHDGDTITLLNSENEQIKVRLEGIDAPELKQAYGTKAKEALSALVLGKSVKIVVTGADLYGRTLGNVYVGETWVNLELVKMGFAWHFKKYNKDTRLAAAEVAAREASVGLWKDDLREAPWDYRARIKTDGKAAKQ